MCRCSYNVVLKAAAMLIAPSFPRNFKCLGYSYVRCRTDSILQQAVLLTDLAGAMVSLVHRGCDVRKVESAK